MKIYIFLLHFRKRLYYPDGWARGGRIVGMGRGGRLSSEPFLVNRMISILSPAMMIGATATGWFFSAMFSEKQKPANDKGVATAEDDHRGYMDFGIRNLQVTRKCVTMGKTKRKWKENQQHKKERKENGRNLREYYMYKILSNIENGFSFHFPCLSWFHIREKAK